MMLNEKVGNCTEDELAMFDDHLCWKSDLYNHAAFDLIKALLDKDPNIDINDMPDPEWDLDLISQIVESAEEILRKAGLPVCRPYHEVHDIERPCYKCGECTSPDCPFKTDT